MKDCGSLSENFHDSWYSMMWWRPRRDTRLFMLYLQLGGNVTVIPKKKARRGGGGGKSADLESKSEKALMSLQGNQQLNKVQKQSLKKMKKQRERQIKLQGQRNSCGARKLKLERNLCFI